MKLYASNASGIDKNSLGDESIIRPKSIESQEGHDMRRKVSRMVPQVVIVKENLSSCPNSASKRFQEKVPIPDSVSLYASGQNSRDEKYIQTSITD